MPKLLIQLSMTNFVYVCVYLSSKLFSYEIHAFGLPTRIRTTDFYGISILQVVMFTVSDELLLAISSSL